METRVPSTVNVTTTISAARITPTQPKIPFAEVMGQTAVVGAEAAMRILPGGPVMAAALRTGGAQALGAARPAPVAPMQTLSQPLGQSSFSPPSSLASPTVGPTVNPAVSAAAASAAEGPGAVAPSGSAGTAGSGMNIDGALAQSQDMNLYYLRIQEQVNAENRSFTTISNVMKAEHETVKTAIGNIR